MLRELIRDAGYTGKQLRAAGFSVRDFLASPCSITEIKGAGFSGLECTEGGLNRDVVEVIYRKRKPSDGPKPAVIAGGMPPLRVPQEIVEVSKLREAGLTCEEAKAGGLLPSQCHQAGFSFEEGKMAGFKRRIADWISMELTNPYNKWH